MEELNFRDDTLTGATLSVVKDSRGREWTLEITQTGGYPPEYRTKLDGKKVPGSPFDSQDRAHAAALEFIDARSRHEFD
jgi:hypothetical protein